MRAIKIINKNQYMKKKINEIKVRNEVRILKMLDHPNVIKVFEAFECERFYYIVTEFCSGDTLLRKIAGRYIKKFKERRAAKCLR